MRILPNRIFLRLSDNVLPDSQCEHSAATIGHDIRSSPSTGEVQRAKTYICTWCLSTWRKLSTRSAEMVYGRYYERLAALTCLSTSYDHSTNGWWPRVQYQGQTSQAFSVTNGTKQSCVMASLLSTLIFPAMLSTAFRDNDLGALIRFRTDGNVFNLRRLKSKRRSYKVLIRDLLFADECALLAHSVDNIQAITSAFIRSACRFGLTTSLKQNRGDSSAKARRRPLSSNHHHRQ